MLLGVIGVIYAALGVLCWHDEVKDDARLFLLAAFFGVPFAVAIIVLLLVVIVLSFAIRPFNKVAR